MSGENFQELRKGQNVEELSRLSFGLPTLCLFCAGKLRNNEYGVLPSQVLVSFRDFQEHIMFAKLRSCFKLTVNFPSFDEVSQNDRLFCLFQI